MGSSVTMFNNFGPMILKVEIPKDILNKLILLTDKIINDKNKIPWGVNLAGQIEEEVEIPLNTLKKEKLLNVLESYLDKYVMMSLENIESRILRERHVRSRIDRVWLNEMKSGEYNPFHHHDCHVSSVLYLKLPKNATKRNIKDKIDKDGHIEFIDRSTSTMHLQSGTFSVAPTVGTMYVFPSTLLHGVYPFLGEGTRRSIAWNGVYDWSTCFNER